MHWDRRKSSVPSRLHRPAQNPVQPLHKHSRILHRHSLHKQRLFQQQPGGIVKQSFIA